MADKKSSFAYLYILPAFLVMGIVVYYPMLYNIVLSLFSEQVFDEPARFIGLGNYAALLADAGMYNATLLTLAWTFLLTLLQYAAGLITALLLDSRAAASRALRALYILPWIVPAVVTAIAFRFMYNFDYGLINATLRSLGLGGLARAWIATPGTAFGAAIVLGVWKGFPFYMLMLLAGLQTIPRDLINAAQIDGATPFGVLRHIKMPFLMPVTLSSLILGIIWTANYFDGIYLLTGGGPANATMTLPIYIYQTAFSSFELTRASTASILLLVLVVAVAVPYLAVTRKRMAANA
jgi:multiple sugar transport system permease protein